jgi:hypothetical protein
VAAASIPLVVRLHDAAAALTHPVGLPRGVLGNEVSELYGQLLQLRARVEAAGPGANARLAAALSGYADLARGLGGRAAPAVRVTAGRLAALDLRWTQALRDIGSADHVDLAASIPPLLAPTTSAPASTPPKEQH